MKIKYILLPVLLFLSAGLYANETVVRVDDKQIYIDVSELKTPVKIGDTFKVILSTEHLINPTTKKNLGPVYNYSPAGKVVEVQPLYVIGEVVPPTGIAVGQKVVFDTAAHHPVNADPLHGTHKAITYEPVEQEIISLSAADVIAPEDNNIVTLSSKGRVSVWKRDGEQTKELMSYQLPSNKKGLTISALPLRGGETAEIFVSAYDTSATRIDTLVLAVKDDQLSLIQTLPYFAKEMGCGDEKTLWVQKPFVSNARPGNARQMYYANERFTASDNSFPTQRKWLQGLHLRQKQAGEKSPFFYIEHEKVKLEQSDGQKAESAGFFGSTPNRFSHKRNIVKMYPSLQVFGPEETPVIAAVENTAKMGMLSDTFGQYDSGAVYFLLFEKGRLIVEDTVKLGGVAYDLACAPQSLLTAEVLPSGKSSIVEILR